MEIGQDAAHALSLCSSTASQAQLQALSLASLSVLLGAQSEESALSGPAFEAMEVDFIKRTYSALVCLFLEASKNDLSFPELLAFLKIECSLHDSPAEALCDAFMEHKSGLREVLSRTANHSYLPQLLGVDWSLDYCVSSSEDRALREFLYHVRFDTLDPATGKEGKVQFACNVEQLQELVSQPKDACISVEKAVDRR